VSFVDQPFADTFDFTRARVAPYRAATGLITDAPADAPRFDHDPTGTPRGLLVEGRPQFDAPDVLTARAGGWEVEGGTVLHEYETSDGEIRRRAWYARVAPRSVVNACLAAKGRQRVIAYVPGHLPNRAGQVRWRDRFWSLGAGLAAGGGDVLGVQDQIPLIEG
jgi:hypothetical protein